MDPQELQLNPKVNLQGGYRSKVLSGKVAAEECPLQIFKISGTADTRQKRSAFSKKVSLVARNNFATLAFARGGSGGPVARGGIFL